jgi:stearoyl-CoA desaturase (delta-9 desaturase)
MWYKARRLVLHRGGNLHYCQRAVGRPRLRSMEGWTSFTWLDVGAGCLMGLAIAELNLYLVTAVLHRCMCHRAIAYPSWLKRAVALWLYLTVCTSPLGWIAAHLHHHARSDTPEDPHAPCFKGFWRVLLLTWYYVPHWARVNRKLAERYLISFSDEHLLHWMERRSIISVNFYLQLLGSVSFGAVATTFWLARFGPYLLANGYVNAMGHTAGDRRYGNVGTDSIGVFQKVAGYLVGGEPLGHNFHHRYPTSPTFRLKRLDPGFWFAVHILRGVPRKLAQ